MFGFFPPFPSNQAIHSQEMQVESRSQSLPDQAAVPGEVKDLQAELQDTLKALQQHQHDPVNTLDDDKVQRITFQLDFFF